MHICFTWITTFKEGSFFLFALVWNRNFPSRKLFRNNHTDTSTNTSTHTHTRREHNVKWYLHTMNHYRWCSTGGGGRISSRAICSRVRWHWCCWWWLRWLSNRLEIFATKSELNSHIVSQSAWVGRIFDTHWLNYHNDHSLSLPLSATCEIFVDKMYV